MPALRKNAVVIVPGTQYGMLTAIEPAPDKGFGFWKTLCQCGREHFTVKYDLPTGHTKSCGCATADMVRKGKTRHGHTSHGKPSPEYVCWQQMLGRCYNTAHKDYAVYGGAGITVCDRWRDSFEAFLEDMGPMPEKGLTLDRKENSKGYEPENCRWASRKEQSRNLKSNRFLTVDGATKTIGEWAEITGLGDALYRRVYAGWTADKAVKTPKRRPA